MFAETCEGLRQEFFNFPAQSLMVCVATMTLPAVVATRATEAALIAALTSSALKNIPFPPFLHNGSLRTSVLPNDCADDLARSEKDRTDQSQHVITSVRVCCGFAYMRIILRGNRKIN